MECEAGYFGISCQMCLKKCEKCARGNLSNSAHRISKIRKCLEKWSYAERAYHFMQFIYKKKNNLLYMNQLDFSIYYF